MCTSPTHSEMCSCCLRLKKLITVQNRACIFKFGDTSHCYALKNSSPSRVKILLMPACTPWCISAYDLTSLLCHVTTVPRQKALPISDSSLGSPKADRHLPSQAGDGKGPFSTVITSGNHAALLTAVAIMQKFGRFGA